jgi:hypothetical protein
MSATGGNVQEWQKEAFPAAMVIWGFDQSAAVAKRFSQSTVNAVDVLNPRELAFAIC